MHVPDLFAYQCAEWEFALPFDDVTMRRLHDAHLALYCLREWSPACHFAASVPMKRLVLAVLMARSRKDSIWSLLPKDVLLIIIGMAMREMVVEEFDRTKREIVQRVRDSMEALYPTPLPIT